MARLRLTGFRPYPEAPDELWIEDGRFCGPLSAPFESMDLGGRWLTPGLIDCHTHLVYAGNRANEFEARLQGKTYAEIAREGGGIWATVQATRQASFEDLMDSARRRLDLLVRQGVTTVDIKSGYGLDPETEHRMLAVAKRLGEDAGIRVVRGFLAAHAIPPGRSAEDFLLEMLAEVETADADYVDAFLESIAFSAKQVDQLFAKAKSCGKRVRLHADQLTAGGGGTIAAKHRALSADHVEYTTEACVEAMAAAGTVAVLLPVAFYTLRETQKPPIDVFRDRGVPMAVATDHNPGSAPLLSLLLAMNMAAVLFGMTVREVWDGVTLHAARALGLEEVGRLAPGFVADFCLWDFEHPRDLVAGVPTNAPEVWVAGKRYN